MKRAVLTCLVAFGSIALLAACGGGGGGPSKSEYIAKVDKICKTYNAKSDTVGKGLSQKSPPEDFQAAFKKVVPILREGLDKERAVEKPSADKDKLNAIFDNVDKGIQKLDKGGQSAASAKAILQGSDPFAEANKAADSYGFKVCGK
jgi:hypothetical protein